MSVRTIVVVVNARTQSKALHKSLLTATDVASLAVFVEAIDSDAANFYRKYGFIELPQDKLKLLLPMKTIAKSFSV
jgi:hypothetical protein